MSVVQSPGRSNWFWIVLSLGMVFFLFEHLAIFLSRHLLQAKSTKSSSRELMPFTLLNHGRSEKGTVTTLRTKRK